MSKRLLQGFAVIILALIMVGCKNVQTRVYSESRQRVDQDMHGNFGYLYGTPVPEDRTEYRTTRKFYVVEFTEADEVVEEEVVEEEVIRYESDDEQAYEGIYEEDDTIVVNSSEPTRNYSFGDFDTPPPVKAAAPTTTSYVVQKNDTLQKISKKFYNSYSKWPKIYEVNKDVIAEPGLIKPGMTLQIPQE